MYPKMRGSMARGRGILHDLGMVVAWAATSFISAIVEPPHNPAGAERELRDGYEILETKGETAFLSLVAAFLAEALFQQGRGEEPRR